jgi:hypothetical protein
LPGISYPDKQISMERIDEKKYILGSFFGDENGILSIFHLQKNKHRLA